MKIFGIKNCDTVRKARQWLNRHEIEHDFHDLRSDGLELTQLDKWADQLGWEQLLNRRSATYRQLPPEQTKNLDRNQALALMLEFPTLIKRPVAVNNGEARVGFREEDWKTWLNQVT